MVKGHAIFWEPPSRASLGKHNKNFCKVPVNNNHMSLWCGGIVVSTIFTVSFKRVLLKYRRHILQKDAAELPEPNIYFLNK